MKNFKTLRCFFNLTQDEIARKLQLDKNTITAYEIGKAIPSFKVLIKIVHFFEVSFDFLILGGNCLYSKNLKLLRLASKLDNSFHSRERSHVEITAQSFLPKENISDITVKQDNIEGELSDSFHLNLKNIRCQRNLKQMELVNMLKVSKSSLAMYESKSYPSIEKLRTLSEILNVSIHALATGEKLFFDFQDRPFGKTMLLADRFLSLEHQKFLIELMENLINNK